jgi:hypothetical protein
LQTVLAKGIRMNEAEFDLEFTVEEMINLYGINSLEDLDRID